MKYVVPLNSAAYPEREGKYITANPATGLKGSTVPGESIEHSMREIVHVIQMAGLTPSSADLTQLYQAIMLLYPEVEGFLPLAGGTMEGSILANSDNTISIGAALKRLKEIFAVRFRGIADSADKLQTARKINDEDFDGTEDISVLPHSLLLLNDPGYIVFYGGGLMIQWGKVLPGTSTGPHAITFPLAFPTACLMAGGFTNGSWQAIGGVRISTWSKTGATIFCNNEPGNTGNYLNWIAIGY